MTHIQQREGDEEALVVVDDTTPLWTAKRGSGPAVVLCHGGPGTHDDLAPIADMLGDRYTVLRWDQRGSGRSRRTGPYTRARFVADLEALRTHFGYDDWVVGGHSWGASLALLYALDHPDRTRAMLYLSGTGLSWAKWKVAYHEEEESRLTPAERTRFLSLKAMERSEEEEFEFRVLQDMPNFADRRRARALAEADVREMLAYPINQEANGALSAEVDAIAERDLVAQCRELTVPTLVVHGAMDPRPAAAVDSLTAALPDCTSIVLPDAGHLPWIEDPEGLGRTLDTFLAQAAPGTA
jgi:proline iminopeptidase